MTLPFPKALDAEWVSLNSRVPDEEFLNRFKSRASFAADVFGKLKKKPARHAAVVYVGLCYLRELYNAGKIDEASDICRKAHDKILPEAGGSKGINCSHFSTPHTGFANHGVGINRAMNLFLPDITSMKKRCVVLLSIGATNIEKFALAGHNSSKGAFKLPKNDLWVETSVWAPPPPAQ